MTQPLKIEKNSPSNPIRQLVKQVTFQSETFWPGYCGADIAISPQKHPNLKIYKLPQQQIIQLEAKDGSIYEIPFGNCKGWELYKGE